MPRAPRRRMRAAIARPSDRARPPSREALLAGVAEALLIDRALPTLLDPDAHAVTIVVSRVGTTTTAVGLGIVARALSQPAWFDERPARTRPATSRARRARRHRDRPRAR